MLEGRRRTIDANHVTDVWMQKTRLAFCVPFLYVENDFGLDLALHDNARINLLIPTVKVSIMK
jgi:hypothetical protein